MRRGGAVEGSIVQQCQRFVEVRGGQCRVGAHQGQRRDVERDEQASRAPVFAQNSIAQLPEVAGECIRGGVAGPFKGAMRGRTFSLR